MTKITSEEKSAFRSMAVGHLTSFLLPAATSEIEHLRQYMPYAQDLLSMLRGERSNSERIDTLRDKIASVPHLRTASWRETPLEEQIISAITSLHTLRRQTRPFSFDRTENYSEHSPMEWFEYLPVAFIGWQATKEYFDAIRAVYEILGTSIDMEYLQYAYYEYAANEFYKYDLGSSNDYNDLFHILASVDQKISGIPAGARSILIGDSKNTMQLYDMVTEYGFGSFTHMKICARMFDDYCEKKSRQDFSKALKEILSPS